MRHPRNPARLARYGFALGLGCATTIASALEVFVRDEHGAPIRDAVVFAAQPGLPPSAPPGGMIDQIDKRFVPEVSAVAAGSLVTFPNKDDIKHHVYSFSPAKTFELKLYHGVTADPVMFDEPGLVALGCNIHDGMVAYLYVVAAPYFGLTDAAGRMEFPALAPGDYVVTAWHYQMTGEFSATGPTLAVSPTTPPLELSIALSTEQRTPPPLE